MDNLNTVITIATGRNRMDQHWLNTQYTIAALYHKLSAFQRGNETVAEYLELPKAQQDVLKDIGGYVGGVLNSQRRKASSVSGRSLITLDLDNIPDHGADNVLQRIQGLNVSCCVHSTRKHTPQKPRLRLVIPLAALTDPDEYEPIARKIAERIGIGLVDPSTFEASRMMFWPSACKDSDGVFEEYQGKLLDPKALLRQYDNWHDVTAWPRAVSETLKTARAAKQNDPTTKPGVIGAFCRTYDIETALNTFLPGLYERCEWANDRYTYVDGTTSGGAILYDNGTFMYSHHATDPCHGQLVNAFDLVRIHKFGDMDADVSTRHGYPPNRRPSFLAMCDFARNDGAVRRALAIDDLSGAVLLNEAESDTPGLSVEETKSSPDVASVDCQSEDYSWTEQLTRDRKGALENTISNATLILENAPELRGRIYLDEVSNRIRTSGNLPWRTESSGWTDYDTMELRLFFQTRYHGFSPPRTDMSNIVKVVAGRHKAHPLYIYLKSLTWDGVPRLDTLFIDYLGAEDDSDGYARAVTRKALTAAVYRVMEPGCKFDNMLTLVGAQGRGKSSTLQRLAGGADRFTDSIGSFEGSGACEAIKGKWIVEIAEMQAFDRVTMNQAKAFISRQSDYYRAPYAELPEDQARQCVFFGTTNNDECLRDDTGGRRFWPLDIDAVERKKDIQTTELEAERDQIWAEAVVRYCEREPLMLSPELIKVAAERQEKHREKHLWEDIIHDFINKPIPSDWGKWDLEQRLMYWSGSVNDDTPAKQRDRVCIQEVWQEALRRSPSSVPREELRLVKGILRNLKGWHKCDAVWFGKIYGTRVGYRRG